MTSEQWALVKAIYSEALEIDPHRRDQWLRDRTQLPAAVIEEVVRLLAASQNATTLAPSTRPDSEEAHGTLIGHTLLNRFEVISLLGSGAMGDVYCAFDQSVQETVAFKTIKPHLAERREFIQSLTREVTFARRVSHENVCQIRDLHNEPYPPAGPLLFFTMELLPGATLGTEVSHGAIPLTEAFEIAKGIAQGLAAIHARELIHRDLKPSNVFLVRSAAAVRAVITDFGLCFDARRPVAETLTAFGADAVVGTPAYMAPEQLLGKGATRKSDIYSFGVVLFEMVTGRQPFAGETPLAIALRRLQDDAPEARSLVPSLPPRWNAVIAACLARDPEKRPDSALDVIATIEGHLALPAKAVSRRAVISGATALLTAVGGVAVWRHLATSPPDPKAEYHLKIAQEFIRQSTPDSILSGLAELKQAVVIDPQYALAWANLADAYCLASTFSAIPSSRALPLASEAASRALALNDRLGLAHAASAYVQACDLHNWRRAEAAFKQAITVDPKEPSPRSWYAAFLGRAGRSDEAVAMAQSALDLEPGSLHFSYRLGTELVRARLFERGRSHMENFVLLHPAEASGYCLLARADEWLKRFGEAERALSYADRLPDSATRCNWATLSAAEGQFAEAARATDAIREGWLSAKVETNVYLYALGALYNSRPAEPLVDTIAEVMRKAILRQDETVLAAASNIYLHDVRVHPKLHAIFKELDFPNLERTTVS